MLNQIHRFRYILVRNISDVTQSWPFLHANLKLAYRLAKAAETKFLTLREKDFLTPQVKKFLEELDNDSGDTKESPSYSELDPELSVIILNWNNAQLTLSCIRELHKHTHGVRFEIVVVDNGSNENDFVTLATSNLPFRLIRLKTNRFYGEGNNIGVANAKGNILFFLNNDAFVTSGWALPLITHLRTDLTIGAVAPKMIYPDGKLQEAGAVISEDGAPMQIGKYQSPDDPKFNSQYEVDYGSAAALLMRKADFEKVNGFDMRWEPAYYEDVDLCLRIKSLNKKIWYDPASTVIHIENFSSKDPKNKLNFNGLIAANHRKFIQKWQPFFKTRDTSFVTHPAPLPKNSQDKTLPTAGVYTPYNLNPGGGERFLFSFISVLAEKYNVVLFLDEIYSEYRLRGLFEELGVHPSNVTIEKRDRLGRYQIHLFLCLGNEILPPMPPIGTEKNLYICQFPFPITPKDFAGRWSYINNYDNFIAYSSYSEFHISHRLKEMGLPQKPVTVLAPPCGSACPDPYPKTEKDPFRIVSVGRFFRGGHSKNHHVVVDLFIKLTKFLPDQKIELHLAGTVSPDQNSAQYFQEVELLASGYPVKLYPNISINDLHHLYRTGSIYVHATGYKEDVNLHPERMEHFGITVVEAMSFGLVPLVYAVGGPAEIVHDGLSGFTYSDEAAFLEKATMLVSDNQLRNKLSGNAIKKSEEFTDAKFRLNALELI